MIDIARIGVHDTLIIGEIQHFGIRPPLTAVNCIAACRGREFSIDKTR
jgi:hypothetical protein